jgi:mono/diheme cytochrome c family protein
MIPTIRQMGLDLPEFRGSEILDLFAYLRSQGRREAARDFRSAGNPERGARLFATKGCTRCHPIFGEGPEIGPDLGTVELRGSVTQLAGRMWNHWPAMSEAMGSLGMSPPTFAGEELADLFAYLFIIRYEGRAGDADRGAIVFRQKGCAVCHGQEGQGDSGPDLRGATRGEAGERIVQRMWNHGPRMQAKMGVAQIPWPRFEADELADLLAFLASGWKDSASPGQDPRP